MRRFFQCTVFFFIFSLHPSSVQVICGRLFHIIILFINFLLANSFFLPCQLESSFYLCSLKRSPDPNNLFGAFRKWHNATPNRLPSKAQRPVLKRIGVRCCSNFERGIT
jgi:hypothetical protein